MIIDCISDLHGNFPKLEGGDLLIIAGDMTRSDTVKEWMKFYAWLNVQKYRQIVFISGNHDNALSRCITSQERRELANAFPQEHLFRNDNCEYLCDNGFEFEGLKIWGSPWTHRFHGQNKLAMAFTTLEEALEDHFKMIPRDTDILITHSPPFGMLDECDYGRKGSRYLADHVMKMMNLELHVFGHIHDGHGIHYPGLDEDGPISVNAALVDDSLEMINKPTRVLLSDRQKTASVL